jgi:flagellar biosynthesis protein FliR
MHAELSFQLATLYGFLLALARVSGVVVFVPLPGFSAGPDASRVVLALALTVALYPAWSSVAVQAVGQDGQTLAVGRLAVGRLAGSVVLETLTGVTVGLAVAFLLEGVQLAAQALGLQAGYSYASTVDPTTQADTTTLQVMAQLLAGTLFFAFGFDRQVLGALARSFHSVTGPALSRNGPAIESMVGLGAAIFATGLQLAIPVLALLVLLDVAFGVLGRLHAQLQLLSLSFAIKMLAALLFLASVLWVYPRVFESSGAVTFAVLDRVLSR